MIKNKQDLKDWLKYEKGLYELSNFDIITRSGMYWNWRYVKLLRYCEYHRNCGTPLHYFLFAINRIKKNRLGMKIGVDIGENHVGRGLLIYHNGSIVVNGIDLKIGENLKLHGANCIGNNGKNFDSPIIGDNVELGVGAIIIGGVTIGNNVVIAANATVINDCKQDNVVLAGTPAKIKKCIDVNLANE
ncbi:MAG: poly-gamma-glutamate biosynthesis protein [Clostridia bacterium]|nr:poly-gamma-glutamate biosynthesis protein [Clostridia bacterium]